MNFNIQVLFMSSFSWHPPKHAQLFFAYYWSWSNQTRPRQSWSFGWISCSLIELQALLILTPSLTETIVRVAAPLTKLTFLSPHFNWASLCEGEEAFHLCLNLLTTELVLTHQFIVENDAWDWCTEWRLSCPRAPQVKLQGTPSQQIGSK